MESIKNQGFVRLASLNERIEANILDVWCVDKTMSQCCIEAREVTAGEEVGLIGR